MLIEVGSATRIQRCYRGYLGRRLVRRRRLRFKLEPIFKEKRRRWKAVSLLQRLWRGHCVRYAIICLNVHYM